MGRLVRRTIDSAFHEFRVDYEQTKHLGIGRAIYSDTFSADSNLVGSTDVSFNIHGETFHAHRAVLAARLPILKALMSSITLHDIAPATFRVMLQFMYTDALPRDDELGDSPAEMMQHLLAAADRYGLDQLKLMCAQKLGDSVSVDTVAATLTCAEMYSCPELKNKCIDFFVMEGNFKKAMLTKGFVQLGQKFPSIIDELRERVGL
ncbi:unnamed protein product [Urochloa decumbens]|uniref:BTB domain-containing protein n=1 Tax=Urochloa decumbens TaxID=240449 RepID=A0ABC9C3F9_9POAL